MFITLENKKRILVIDDEIDICIMLKVVLEQNEFIINYYYQPIIALDEFKPNFYDLIILDIEMPEINGLQLYREIRKIDSHVKICFLTAGEMYYGAYDDIFNENTFIRKPIENEELVNKENEIINS